MAIAEIAPAKDDFIVSRGQSRAHRLLHSLETDRLPPSSIRTIGNILCRSELTMHRIDGAWAYMQAGYDETNPRLVLLAKQVLQTLTFQPVTADEQVQIRMAAAAADGYLAMSRGERPDAARMAERLRSVNDFAFKHRYKSRRVPPLAHELAAAYLLNRHSAGQPGGGQLMAWPSAPWQDSAHARQADLNFDVLYGPTPEVGHRIQVISRLDQEDACNIVGSEDGDDLLDYWHSSYHPQIKLIFSTVHMHSTAQDPCHINRHIASPESAARDRELDIVTRNILDELGITG